VGMQVMVVMDLILDIHQHEHNHRDSLIQPCLQVIDCKQI
jgi:hypothetical protein